MMKLFLIFWTVVLLASCSGDKPFTNEAFANNFLNAVLDDIGMGSYYIAVPLCGKSNTEYLVIENNELFLFFKETKNLNLREYKEKINLIFENNSCLEREILEDEYFKDHVISSQEIEENSVFLTDTIRAKFDENGVQLDPISDNLARFIIYERFKSRCLIRTDDMSGKLVYKVW
jgi:hypothetical protein